jgi:FkbM family methyltransferase
MKYSQNTEEEVILNYFGDEKITVLSVGENDGISLSNVRALLLNGSRGTLVEPAPEAFFKLTGLYLDRKDIFCVNVAVSDFIGNAIFYDSGTHLNNGDKSLLSSLNEHEIKKWEPTTKFNKIKVDVVDFKTLLNLSPYKQFDFISIDAEGLDMTILKQINLKELGCRMLCVEWNSNHEIIDKIKDICEDFGLSGMLLKNGENVIMAEPK